MMKTDLAGIFTPNSDDVDKVLQALWYEGQDAAKSKIMRLNPLNPFDNIKAADEVVARYDGLSGLLYLLHHVEEHRQLGEMDAECGFLDVTVAFGMFLRIKLHIMTILFRHHFVRKFGHHPQELLAAAERLIRDHAKGEGKS